MATFSYWHGIANSSGSSGLSSITDASYPGDPAGTDCNSAYWNARAYDQLNAIFTTLGSSPGSGVTGNFTLNNDATGDETSSLIFETQGVGGSNPSLTWNASVDAFVFNKNIEANGLTIGTSGRRISKLWVDDIDMSDDLTVGGDLTVSGASQVEALTVLGTLTAASINLQTELTFTGSTLTLNSSVGDSTAPSTSGLIKVNRGSLTDAFLKWSETGSNSTSKWQAYNITTSAYNDLALLDSSGFTNTEVFSSSGTGSSRQVARADHTHASGTVSASGTENSSFELDSNYSSGSVNIELRFAASSNYIRYNPGDSNPRFVFSDDIETNKVTAVNADITGSLNLTGSLATDVNIKGNVITLDSDASAASATNSDVRVSLGTNGYRTIRWDGDTSLSNKGTWKFSNDGTNYSTIVGADSSGDITLTGKISGTLNTSSDYLYLRKGATDDADGGISITRASGNKSLYWLETSETWRFADSSGTYNIVGATKTQTLTGKTLTNPSITNPVITSAGSWAGDPSFSGNPTFSGTPTFSSVPSFSIVPDIGNSYSAPFTVTSTSRVTNLNADRVDSKHVDDTSTSSSSLWTASKIISYFAATTPTNADKVDNKDVDDSASTDAVLWTASKISSYVSAQVSATHRWYLRAASTNYEISNNEYVELIAGSGLSLAYDGSTGVNQVTFSHPTSSGSSVNNSGTTVVQDITLDSFGHITSIGSSNPFASSPAFTAVAPFTVSSSNLITNLNADKLDGIHASSFAGLASPTFTGTPAAPTADSSINNTQIATTAYVTTAVAAAGGGGNVFASGVYIGGSGSSNFMDEYEEGSWTPTIHNVVHVSYSVQNGYYTRVGNMLTVYFYVAGSGAASGTVGFGGLPVNSANVANVYPASQIAIAYAPPNDIYFYIGANANYAQAGYFVGNSSATSHLSYGTGADNASNSNFSIHGTFTYRIA